MPEFEITVGKRGRSETSGACRFYAVEKLFHSHWFVLEYQLKPEALGTAEPPLLRTLLLADFGAVTDVVERHRDSLLTYRTSIAVSGTGGWVLRQLEKAFAVFGSQQAAFDFYLRDGGRITEPLPEIRPSHPRPPIQIYWAAGDLELAGKESYIHGPVPA